MGRWVHFLAVKTPKESAKSNCSDRMIGVIVLSTQHKNKNKKSSFFYRHIKVDAKVSQSCIVWFSRICCHENTTIKL